MKIGLTNVAKVLFSTEKRPTSFYLLAFVPLLLMSFFYVQYPLGLMVPLYGFILLLLKKDKLFSRSKAPSAQKLFGLIVIFASFFVYFFASPFIPVVAFYGLANYFVYVVGLFLVFFEIHALKEAFSPLFLIVAFVSSSYASNLAGSLFTPYIPHFTSLIAAILRTMGIKLSQSFSDPNMIILNTPTGLIPIQFVWACVGFISTYTFSIILVILLSEEASNIKTKIIWAIIGVLGTFFANIIRILALFAGFYLFGYETGEMIHSYIGYVLFITWSIVFLYLFSKRDTISQKIRMLYARAKHPNTTANKSIRLDAKNFVKR